MQILIGFILILFAGSINAAEKVVVIPLGGDINNYLVEPANLIDIYVELPIAKAIPPQNHATPGTYDIEVFTVPADKHVVITDIIGTIQRKSDVYAPLGILENSTVKLRFNLGTVLFADTGRTQPLLYDQHVRLGSGLTFQPNSVIKVQYAGNYGYVTLTGYSY